MKLNFEHFKSLKTVPFKIEFKSEWKKCEKYKIELNSVSVCETLKMVKI